MSEVIENICKSLEELSDAVNNQFAAHNKSDDNRTFNELFGWSCPAIAPKDLVHMPRALSERIKQSNFAPDDANLLERLKIIPKRIAQLKTSILPHFNNPNASKAVPAYIATLEWIINLIEQEISGITIKNSNAMPQALSRRLDKLKDKIDALATEEHNLTPKVALIKEAIALSDKLPETLKELDTAEGEIKSINTEAIKTKAKIDSNEEGIDALLEKMQSNKEETDKLVSNCEEAYRITTSKGLAGAFDERAKRLNMSMQWWVGGLASSLILAAFLGLWRIPFLNDVLSNPDIGGGIASIHFLITITSFGVPLWFAWLSTKQIDQRFKLAEDYGFKASVAKAYEGYRKEAAKFDSNLEERLFTSALTRLEEAPLRLISEASHSSPLQEITSTVFRNDKDHETVEQTKKPLKKPTPEDTPQESSTAL